MKDHQNQFEFTGAIFKEGRWYVSLCLELDVASQGRTIREAKKMLAEAVELHLETCIENNIPYVSPVPRSEDPRFNPPENLVETFPFAVTFRVQAAV
jgi:predicted RNase H-like HicB family nuclease